MRHHLSAALLAATAAISLATQANAQGYTGNRAFCAEQYTSSGLIVRCHYDNIEQCRAFLSGLGGTCSANLYSRPAANLIRR